MPFRVDGFDTWFAPSYLSILCCCFFFFFFFSLSFFDPMDHQVFDFGNLGVWEFWWNLWVWRVKILYQVEIYISQLGIWMPLEIYFTWGLVSAITIMLDFLFLIFVLWWLGSWVCSKGFDAKRHFPRIFLSLCLLRLFREMIDNIWAEFLLNVEKQSRLFSDWLLECITLHFNCYWCIGFWLCLPFCGLSNLALLHWALVDKLFLCFVEGVIAPNLNGAWMSCKSSKFSNIF